MTAKEMISYGVAVASMAAGFVLVFLGYFAPPEGEISSGVLYAFGEVALFVGSVFGISAHCREEMRKMKKV